MPNFDRTGPQGAGPMTGGGRGPCGGRHGAWTEDPIPGGRRRGRGRGRGFGRGKDRDGSEDATLSPLPMVGPMEEETPLERRAVLKAERNRLKARLREVEDTLKAIGRDLAGDTDT